MRSQTLVLYFSLLSVFSCKVLESPALMQLQIDIEEKKEYNLSQIIDIHEEIQLDSSAIIGSIEKVVHKSNNFYVGDFNNTQSVICFDKSGKLIRTYKSKSTILDFEVDELNDELLLLTSENSIEIYPLDGHGITLSYRPDFFPTKIIQLPDNRFAFRTTRSPISKELQFDMIITDSEFNVKKGHLAYSEPCQLYDLDVNTNFNNSSDGFTFVQYLNNRVFRFCKNQIDPVYQINFTGSEIPTLKNHCSIPFPELMKILLYIPINTTQ